MTKEQAILQIEKEFTAASQAQAAGNDGMVRVCARRAAGVAIDLWLQSHSRLGWGINAMHQLRSLRLDERMPRDIRDAAERLTTKVTAAFTSSFPTNPIDDSKIIINHLWENT